MTWRPACTCLALKVSPSGINRHPSFAFGIVPPPFSLVESKEREQLKSICLCCIPLPPFSFLFPFSPEIGGVKSPFLGAEIFGMILRSVFLPCLQLDSATIHRCLPPHRPTRLLIVSRCVFQNEHKFSALTSLLNLSGLCCFFPIGTNRAEFLLHPLPPALVYPLLSWSHGLTSKQTSSGKSLLLPSQQAGLFPCLCVPPKGSRANSSGQRSLSLKWPINSY